MLDREGVELEKLETDPSALELGENGDSGPDGEDGPTLLDLCSNDGTSASFAAYKVAYVTLYACNN